MKSSSSDAYGVQREHVTNFLKAIKKAGEEGLIPITPKKEDVLRAQLLLDFLKLGNTQDYDVMARVVARRRLMGPSHDADFQLQMSLKTQAKNSRDMRLI